MAYGSSIRGGVLGLRQGENRVVSCQDTTETRLKLSKFLRRDIFMARERRCLDCLASRLRCNPL
jgi:hypothetical protein